MISLEEFKYFIKKIKSTASTVVKILHKVLFTTSFLLVFLMVYDFGFDHSENLKYLIARTFNQAVFFFLLLNLLRLIGKVLLLEKVKEIKLLRADIVLLIILWVFHRVVNDNLILPWNLNTTLLTSGGFYALFLLVFGVEFSRNSLQIGKYNLNPQQLFILSFAIIIILGTGLLLLPNSTTNGISVLDALFTATSAVCVTGLIVLDTAKDFSETGQFIIMMLFQIGGLGIMTFTSFIGLFYMGGASFKDQLLLKDLTNSDKMGAVYKNLVTIIIVTLFVEGIGAAMLYATTLNAMVEIDHVWALKTSIFHAISAYCNAGFSIWSEGLAAPFVLASPTFQLSICALIIFGGIGYPIVFNYFKISRYFLGNLWRIIRRQRVIYKPSLININTRMVLWCSTILLALGTLVFFFTENKGELNNMSFGGKLLGAFFASVTARTAGFNTTDFSMFSTAGIFFMFILMWIGASPLSTGGGIKTTTISVAFLSFFKRLRGKKFIDYKYRVISSKSIGLAYGVILSSVVFIGLICFLLALFEPTLSIKEIAFEAISAVSTVGLTLGVTPNLNSGGKLVIVFAMFIGRVGLITVLLAFLKKRSFTQQLYPEEHLLLV